MVANIIHTPSSDKCKWQLVKKADAKQHNRKSAARNVIQHVQARYFLYGCTILVANNVVTDEAIEIAELTF